MRAQANTPRSAARTLQSRRRHGTWCIADTSTAFKWFAYDATQRALTAQFTDGSAYRYQGVSASVARALFANDSVGKFFNEEIRGKYPATRLA
jgi:hypothetical protein